MTTGAQRAGPGRAAALLGLALAAMASAAEPGAISGVVTYVGPPPVVRELRFRSDPACAQELFRLGSVIVGPDGKGLKDVVLRLPAGPLVEPAASVSAEPVVVTQRGCVFEPHVQVVRAGQGLRFVNGDPTVHNVRGYAGPRPLFNQITQAGQSLDKVIAGQDVMKVTCDVHPWMVAWVAFSASPFFAVSGPDGRFAISGLPAGKYTLEAWHESLGRRAVEVTVAAGRTTEVRLELVAATADGGVR